MIRFTATEKPDEEQRRCYDCEHLGGAVGLWCTNDDVAEAGYSCMITNGYHDCKFWEPMRWKEPRKLINPIVKENLIAFGVIIVIWVAVGYAWWHITY